MQKRVPVKTVDAYLRAQPAEIAEILETIRQTIKVCATDAEEVISYAIPAFKLNKVFVFFAGFAKHYSIFFRPDVMTAFKDELKSYKTSKSAINIPLDKGVPVSLVKKMVKYAMKYDADEAAKKKKK